MLVKQFMQIFLKRILCCLPFLVLFLLTACKDKDSVAVRDWPVYGGTPENNHYSALDQINRSNVKNLQVAWSYDTGEQGGLQTSPLMVGDVFYGISPTQKVFALNAATGKELWKFDAGTKGLQPDRGLAYWSSGSDHRIFVGVMNFVYALDAATGKPIPAFGKDGRTVVTGCDDATSRIWDIATSRPIGPMLRHDAALRTAVFAENDRQILTGTSIGTTYIWNVSRAPLESDVEQIVLSLQVSTGMELGTDGEVRPLSPDIWRERSKRLAAFGNPQRE